MYCRNVHRQVEIGQTKTFQNQFFIYPPNVFKERDTSYDQFQAEAEHGPIDIFITNFEF